MPSHVPAKAPVATNPYHAQLDMVFEKIDAILANPKETMKPEKVPIWFADAVADIHADGWLDTVAPFKVMDTIPGGQEPGLSMPNGTCTV